MFAFVLITGLLLQSTPGAQEAKTAAAVQATSTPNRDADADPAALLKVKRIFVDSFGDDAISKELQSMIVSALVASKRFKVTENRERADAILKGVALEKTSQELHAYGESTAVGTASGASHGELSGANGTVSGSHSGGFIAQHMGTSDSSVNTETINDARVAVRLVNPDGDVIWTSTQESKGGKYKGASADAADRCIKQLLKDVEKLEGAGKSQPAAAQPAATLNR
jgi:curli biogenesis system outer membrane secretion channel CsgG